MWHRYPACITSGGNIFFFNQIVYACTNNLAEYEVVRKGMELLLEAGAEVVEIFGDSKLVISQLTEEYRCESESLLIFMVKIKKLISQKK
jgi:ribonuclease HI